MPSRPTSISRVALVVMAAWAITTIAVVASIVLLVLGRPRPLPNDVLAGVGGLSFALLAFAFASVGAMVVLRVRANAVGWIFVAGGLLTGLGLLADQYAAYVLTRGSSAPGVAYAAWLATPATQAMAALLGLTLLLFPDGRLPSARWRPAAAVGWLAAVLLVGAPALRSGSLEDPFPTVVNSLGIPGTHGALKTAEGIGWLLAMAGMAVGAAAAVTRLRRAQDDERQQLKLVLTAGAVVAAVATLDMVGWLLWPHGHLQLHIAVIGLSFTAVAVAAGIAILRYRLYDIDLVIDRTVAYALLTVLLAAGYAVITLVLATALGSGSNWATAGATLAVAIAFRPLPPRTAGGRRPPLQPGPLRSAAQGRGVPRGSAGRAGGAGGDRGVAARPARRPDTRGAFLPARERALRQRRRDAGNRRSRRRPRELTDRARRRAGGADRPPARRGAAVAAAGAARPPPVGSRSRSRACASSCAVSWPRSRRHGRASWPRGTLERRRIERDLHDGAQQRLVSIGLQLRHAQFEIGDVPDEQTSGGRRSRSGGAFAGDRRAARAGPRAAAGAARRRARTGVPGAGRPRAAAQVPGPHDARAVRGRARGGRVLRCLRGTDQRDQTCAGVPASSSPPTVTTSASW